MMKKTKRFFLTLLSFCLMGNVAFAQGCVDGFYYEYINGKPCVVGYHDDAPSNLVFPKIDGTPVVVYKGFSEGVRNAEDVVSFDLTNVEMIMANSLTNVAYDENWEEVVVGFVNLNEVTVSMGTKYGTNAFSGIPVSTIKFASGVSTITSSMVAPFKSTLTTVELPQTCTAIGTSAFEGCSNLKAVKLRNVKSIGNRAFYNSGLQSVSSDEVLTIGENAFAYCSALTSATFSFAETFSGYAFRNSGLTSFTVAASVDEIPEGMFYDCKGLAGVTLGDVEKIGASAFAYTALSGTINLPGNLEEIGASAFANTNIAGANFYSDPAGVNSAFAGSDVLTLYIENDQLFTSGNTYDNVVYNRSKNGNYGAIVLPFDFAKGNNTYYEFTHFDGGMHFSEVESPKANIPYLYKGNDTKFNGTSYTTGTLSDVAIAKGEEWISHGVYSDHTNNPITTGGYKWAVSGGELKWFQSLKIKPYRAYWACESSNGGVADAKIFIHGRNGETTSINMTEVDGLENMVPVYYDLTGRRVLEPQSGNLYIVNGKKVIF